MSAFFDLVRSPPESTNFLKTFVGHFIATFGVDSAPKNFGEKVTRLVEKRTFLIVNLFLNLNRMDERTCFNSFRSQPSSRQHPINVTFFQLKRMLVVFLFVCLFIHLPGE